MAFKSGFTPRATKVPKIGGSGNALMSMMLAQSMVGQKTTEQEQAKQNVQEQTNLSAPKQAGQVKQNIIDIFGSVPPDTKTKIGETDIPLNRPLSGDERNDLMNTEDIERIVDSNLAFMDKNPERYLEVATKVLSPGSQALVLGDRDAIAMLKDYGNWRDVILRLRSKSQTTEKEFGRLRAFATPTFQDLTVQRDEATGDILPTIRDHLLRTKAQLLRTKNIILHGSQYAIENPTSNQNTSNVDDEEKIWQEFIKGNP